MRTQDAGAAAAAARTALGVLYPKNVTADEDVTRIAAGTARAAHLQRTDPDGCWSPRSTARSSHRAGLIRESVWGFSLFAVLPAFQGLGIGSRLYAPALEYGAREPGGIILPSGRDRPLRPQPGLPAPAHGRTLRHVGSAPSTRRAALPAR